MRPILGGLVPAEFVVGRDQYIDKIWRVLEKQSVIMVSARRTGKTSVIRKMEKEPRPDWRPIYMVIEGVRSPTEFIARIFRAVSTMMSKKKRTLVRVETLFNEVSGQKVLDFTLPELKKHWKRLLRDILDDLKDNVEERVLFLWDEFAIMVDNIKTDLGDETAMELLDELRDYRMEDYEGNLRMIFTGSVGLHLVLSQLRQQGYKNDPINDMFSCPLEALSSEHARELALRLLKGIEEDGEITLADPADDLAVAIAERTDGLPFYIHHAVDRLTDMGRPITTADVETAIEVMLQDPDDKAKFGHYAQRIKPYYQFHEQGVVLAHAILDHLCREDRFISEADIFNALAARFELMEKDKEILITLMENLLKDHYLSRRIEEGIRYYRFQYNIIRRWWRLNRG